MRWTFVLIVALGLSCLSSTPTAQAPSSAPQFEVASIRPASGEIPFPTWEFMPHGDVTFGNADLHLIIALAHGIDIRFARTLLVGSQPVLSKRFDIRAKAPEGSARAQAPAMLRALLEERFGLRSHVETRDIPIYALMLRQEDRLGRGLRRTALDCSSIDRATEPLDSENRRACWRDYRDEKRMHLRDSGPISLLIFRLATFVDRPILDQTGLNGTYEWDVVFATDRNPATVSDYPSLESALASELGLRLAARTGPWEILVIDEVNEPSAN